MSNTQNRQHEESSSHNDKKQLKESQNNSPQSQQQQQQQQIIPKIFSTLSAFSRYQPLTNLQRGNVFHDKGGESQIERSIFTLAAQGEISINDSSDETPGTFPEELRDEKGRTLIHIAAANGQLVTLKSLLTHSSDIKLRLHELRDLEGCTPLHYAAFGGHHTVVKELLSSAEPSILYEFINAVTNDGSTALMYACYFKQVRVARELIKSNFIDLTTKNSIGHTAYSLAVKSNCKEIISMLDSHILSLLKCNS